MRTWEYYKNLEEIDDEIGLGGDDFLGLLGEHLRMIVFFSV